MDAKNRQQQAQHAAAAVKPTGNGTAVPNTSADNGLAGTNGTGKPTTNDKTALEMKPLKVEGGDIETANDKEPLHPRKQPKPPPPSISVNESR